MLYYSSLSLSLSLSTQAAAYGSHSGELTVKMINDCVTEMISQHKQKRVWQDVETNETNE